VSRAPASLVALADYWRSRGGVVLGIVGDERHCRGYHLGRDRIYGSCACRPDGDCVPGLGDRDYSVMASRDKAGLTDDAAAIDLGRLNDSLDELRRFSSALVERCKRGTADTADIREIVWSPDGTTVSRWDREGLPGGGDATHLTHTHISYYRDAIQAGRDLTAAFRAILEDALMLAVVTRQPFPTPVIWRVAAGTTLRGYDPAQPGKVAKEMRFASDSLAHATARVGVSWPGTSPAPIPRGYPFLEVSDGAFAGLLIVEAQVKLDPVPDPAQLARGKALEEARSAAIDAVGKAIDAIPR
jgi:hypothetical protein